jgi:hypothetical protein
MRPGGRRQGHDGAVGWFRAEGRWRAGRSADEVWQAVLGMARRGPAWPRLEELSPPLASAERTRVVIRAPAGYRLRLALRARTDEGRRCLGAEVSGDAAGWAELRVEPAPSGSIVRFRSDLEPRRLLLRALEVLARPLLVDGHDRILLDAAHRFAADTGVELATDALIDPAPRRPSRSLSAVLAAAALAGALSGGPSTVHAVVRQRSPLGATRAAGQVLGRPGLGRGALAHGLLSLGWAGVLSVVLPRRRPVLWGAVAGAGIAALDLGAVGRRLPAIAGLPTAPQVVDHVAFGALVGTVFAATDPDGPLAGPSS